MSKANFTGKSAGFPALALMTANALYGRSRRSRSGQDVRNGIRFRSFESPLMQKQTLNAASRHDLTETGPAPVDCSEHVLLSVLALLLAGVASGRSHLRNLREGPDVDAACRALDAMGVCVTSEEDGLFVQGVGNGALLAPRPPLDFTNAPVALALTVGLVAPYDMRLCLGALVLPEGLQELLKKMGVQMEAGPADELCLRGPETASPQLHSFDRSSSLLLMACLLLAGLNTPGITTLVEPIDTRGIDQTRLEALFAAFGIPLAVRQSENGLSSTQIRGRGRLTAVDLDLLG